MTTSGFRAFVIRQSGVILYFIRIPTRFGMMFLGATYAPLHRPLFLAIFSLSLIAWVHQAPVTVLRPRRLAAEDFRTGERMPTPTLWERIIWTRVKTLAQHVGLAGLSAAAFYMIGRQFF